MRRESEGVCVCCELCEDGEGRVVSVPSVKRERRVGGGEDMFAI